LAIGTNLRIDAKLEFERAKRASVSWIWLSRDPLGEYTGINIYGYVFSDPVNFTDPFGLACREPNQGEKNDINNAIDGLRSFNDPELNRLADLLAGRKYIVDTGLADNNGEKMTLGYGNPNSPNTIFLNPQRFGSDQNALFPNAKGNFNIKTGLLDTMLHEDAHLRFFYMDPPPGDWVHGWVNGYTDRVENKIISLFDQGGSGSGSGSKKGCN